MSETGEPTYRLSSGYTIRVRTLGPYALDPIRDQHRDPGPYTYKVKTAAEGEVDFIYEPPKDGPPEPGGDEYDLYMAWQAHERRRLVIGQNFERAAREFMMLNCIDIVDGPVSVDDEDWLRRLEGRVDPPVTWADRLLLFMQTRVFAVPVEEWFGLKEMLVAPEVDMESIFNALRRFRTDLGWDGYTGSLGLSPQRAGGAQHAAMGGPGGRQDAAE